MIRRALACIALGLLLIAGISTFCVSEGVIEHRRELHKVTAQINAEQERISVLEAEWAYLNAPQRLETLVAKHLPELKAPSGKQQIAYSALPFRNVTVAQIAGGAE